MEITIKMTKELEIGLQELKGIRLTTEGNDTDLENLLDNIGVLTTEIYRDVEFIERLYKGDKSNNAINMLKWIDDIRKTGFIIDTITRTIKEKLHFDDFTLIDNVVYELNKQANQ